MFTIGDALVDQVLHLHLALDSTEYLFSHSV